MAVENIKLDFTNDFEGSMHAPKTDIKIGRGENSTLPYELLFGSLGACFYATFLDITKKMRLTFTSASIEISGTKRKEVPTTLDHVQMLFVIKGARDRDKFIKAADL